MDMWLDADGVTLTIATADGQPLARDTIEGFYLKTKFGTDDGEMIRMSYQPSPDPDDPDAPTPPRKFVRLVLEEIPPPAGYVEAVRRLVTASAGTSDGLREDLDAVATAALEVQEERARRRLGSGPAPTADSGPWAPLGPFTQYETQAEGDR